MTKTLWKSMKAGMMSANGDIGPWKVGEWREHKGQLEMCRDGFHASENVIDAMGYVDAEVIAEVEVRGEHLEQNDKQVWSEMRVLRAWEWTKEDSVSLAVFAAELAIGIYEKKYPNDDRPRKAIEAAREWLKDPSEKNQAAARAAARAASWDAGAAVWAAAGAAGDAWAAARAASWAAGDAWAAAGAAVWAAAGAAGDAWAAAGAAGADIKDKCHAFVLARLEAKP